MNSKVDTGFFTNVKGPQFEGDLAADFSDLRKLHILTDKLQRLIHVLRINIRVGRQLAKEMTRIRAVSSESLYSHFDAIQVKLDSFLFGQETSVQRIETLIARSSGLGQLVSILLIHQNPDSDIDTPRYKAYRIFEQRKQTNRSITRCRG
jgi:hypothetical protein